MQFIPDHGCQSGSIVSHIVDPLADRLHPQLSKQSNMHDTMESTAFIGDPSENREIPYLWRPFTFYNESVQWQYSNRE
jgi:hypothetical protein